MGQVFLNRFEVLKAITDADKFAELVIEMVKSTGTKEELSYILKKELSEKELQTIKSIAQSDYPLSLERKQ